MHKALECRAGRWPQVGLLTHSAVYKCTKKTLSSPSQHQRTLGAVTHTRKTHIRGINGSQAAILLPSLGICFRGAEIALLLVPGYKTSLKHQAKL